MSKAVSISEGGKGRIFPQTDKLKINNVGGGNSLWLPEDEVVTGTLYADENGIYLAENDGFSCYDTVVVRVEDETDPDDPDWELDPDELDEDVWDDESLEEFQEDPEAFEEKFNDKEKWKAEKAKKEKSQKIKKVKSLKPSKITGIDPVDGNPYQVGVDSEGNLTKEMLPSSIHIVVPPWKREYEEGEEINFYGMHVYLLDKDGHPFKSEKYPTGEIPFEELLLPVTTAEGEAGLEEWSDGSINAYKIHYSQFAAYYKGEFRGYVYYSEAIGTNKNGNVYLGGGNSEASLFATQYQGALYVASIEGDNTSIDLYDDTPVVNWEGVKYLRAGTTGLSRKGYFVGAWEQRYATFTVPTSNVNPSGKSIEDMIYSGGSVGVPVQWMRSDGEMLEDSFLITIKEGNNTSGSESEHSGTSDSGSGHTSGGF